MHICHLITGLGAGGTPVMLRNVLRSLQGSGLRFSVIGMIDDMSIGREIEELGIPVRTLGMKPGRPNPRGLWRLARMLRRDPPDLIQTWLYHADLLGAAVARLCANPPVVWNIRHATLTPGVDSRSTLWAAKLSARWSWRGPASIVVNTHAGRAVHINAGYDPSRFEWIPNGFDVDRFRPSTEARESLRAELGVPQATPLIGMVARYSRLKGHDLFIQAMTEVVHQRPDARFVLCGRNMDVSNRELVGLIKQSGRAERWHLLGERTDIPRIQAALDIATSPSRSEAFSNSIGEAMACGIPCVVSDVGDSAQLVDNAGAVVPVEDAAALSAATLHILGLPDHERRQLSQNARSRIEQHYSLQAIADRYSQLWTSIVQQRSPASRRSAA